MKTKILLILVTILSLFLSIYKLNEVPPCLNADEISYGYNAYSIMQTGADEHGNFLPLRLQSFEDFKLPLYTYILIPFIKLFGTTDLAVRFPNIILACLFPILFYSILKKVFAHDGIAASSFTTRPRNDTIALVGAFLVSFSPWIYLLSRQAHEGVLCAFLILLGINALLNEYQKTEILSSPSISSGSSRMTKGFIFGNLFIFLSAFAYHPGRIFLIIIGLIQILAMSLRGVYPRGNPVKPLRQGFAVQAKIIIILALICIPFLIDFAYGANRVNNLLFFNNQGFSLNVSMMLGEDGNRLIHNKGIGFVTELTNRFLYQISPEFLTITGDKNIRFGFPGISNINIVEYLFIFIGIYYLFKNKNKHLLPILTLLFISPLVNAFTWQEYSLNRTYFMIFPILTIVAYGAVCLYDDLVKFRRDCPSSAKATGWQSASLVFVAMTVGLYFFYSFMSWDFYFNHYPKRALVIRGWQCGNEEMAKYVGENYNNFDNFYITRKNGQPYISLLFYNQINPKEYLSTRKVSAVDEYGYTQVNSFDKFNFNYIYDKNLRKTVFIGYPDDFFEAKLDMAKVKKIYSGKEEIFWIVENK